MPDTPHTIHWWQTLPGVLTALAGVITAVSGLVALLYQNGVLGHKADAAATAATQASAGASVSASAIAPAHSPPKPWSEATAVVIGRDGSQTRLRADSLSNCISAGHDLTLISGQSVPFERMASFEVQRADDHTSPSPRAYLLITLLEGAAVSGAIEANCDLFGYNNLGRFTTYFDQVRQVRFER